MEFPLTLSPTFKRKRKKRNSSLHYFFQKVHNIISGDPGNYVCLEVSRLELLHLHKQPVHGVVPPCQGGVLGSQGLSGAHVIGPVADIKNPLETNATTLLFPLGQVFSKDCLLAHVFGATLAGVRVEGTEYKATFGVEVAGVGEDPPEKVAHPMALQPRLNKKGVGVGDHHQLKVLLMALQIAEEVQDAGVGWDPLYS